MKYSHLLPLILNSLKVTAIGAAIALLSACASTSWLKQADSPLPIEVQHSSNGQVMSFRAHETSERLYVAGTAKKHHLGPNAHVDIQLIGAAGEVIAQDQDGINPMHPRPGGGKRFTDSYVVSFPLSEARKAVKIRVIYDSGAHD